MTESFDKINCAMINEAKECLQQNKLYKKAQEFLSDTAKCPNTQEKGKITIIDKILETIHQLSLSCHLPEFTDHSLPHLTSILDRANQWTLQDQTSLDTTLSQYEATLLVIALLIHDIGMLSQNPLDAEGDYGKGLSDIASWVRTTHCIRIPRLCHRLLKDDFPEFVKTKFFELACCIAMAHAEWGWQKDAKHYPRIEAISPEIETEYGGPLSSKRARSLAAIVAVCDLLDEDSTRCDVKTLLLHKHGTAVNLSHWIRHLVTAERVLIKGGKFTVKFRKLQYQKDDQGFDITEDMSGCSDINRYQQFITALQNQFSSALLYNDDLQSIGAALSEPEYITVEPPYPIPWNLPQLRPFWGAAPERLLDSVFRFAREPDQEIQKKWQSLSGSAQFQKLDLDDYNRILGWSSEPLLEEEITEQNIKNLHLAQFCAGRCMNTTNFNQEANQYLLEQALQAHLEGQGAKARHLASLALVEEANDEHVPSLEFNEVAWAFVLLIYWMLDEHDHSCVLKPAWRAFGRKQRGQESHFYSADGPIAQQSQEHWMTLVRFLIDMPFDPSDPSRIEKDIQGLFQIPQEFFQQEWSQLQSAMLSITLDFTLECLYNIAPDATQNENKPQWCQLYEKWISYINDIPSLGRIQASLEKNYQRLQIQGRFFLGEREFLTISPAKNVSDQFNHDMIENFWTSFYAVDIPNMVWLEKKLIEEVKKDKNKHYLVQSLFNMTRWMTRWLHCDSSVENDKKNQELFGVIRIQRLRMEHPALVFRQLQEYKFYKGLEEIRQQLEAKNYIWNDQLVYILRLSHLLTIRTLHDWDLMGYLQSLQMQSQASLLWVSALTISNIEDELCQGIFYAMKSSMIFNPDDYPSIKRAIQILETKSNDNQAIYNLVKQLLQSLQPIETRGAICIFSMLSDAIPSDFVHPILELTISYWKKTVSFFFLGPISVDWLADIMTWYDLKEEDWKLIDSMLTSMLLDRPTNILESETRDMIRQALIHAPRDLAENWAKIIIAMIDQVTNSNFFDETLEILYNAALERLELRALTLELLETIKKHSGTTPELEYNIKLLSISDVAFKEHTQENGTYRQTLLDAYIQYVEKIAQRTEQKKVLQWPSEFPSYKVPRCDWSDLTSSKWEEINAKTLLAIQSTWIDDEEFKELLSVWAQIACQQSNLKVNKAASWLLGLLDISPSIVRRKISNRIEPVTYAKTIAVTRLLPQMSDSARSARTKMMDWLEQQIPYAEEITFPHLVCAMLEMYIHAKSKKWRLYALNLLKAIYIRMASNVDILSKAIYWIYRILNSKDISGQTVIALLSQNEPEPILKILDQCFRFLVSSPDLDGRGFCAYTLLQVFRQKAPELQPGDEWRHYVIDSNYLRWK